MQISKNLKNLTKPPLLTFQVASIKLCLDPLFFQWLDYQVQYYKLNDFQSVNKSENQQLTTESTMPDTNSRKKTFPSLHESVHSSSDKEKKKNDEQFSKSSKKSFSKSNKPDTFFVKSESAAHEVC